MYFFQVSNLSLKMKKKTYKIARCFSICATAKKQSNLTEIRNYTVVTICHGCFL